MHRALACRLRSWAWLACSERTRCSSCGPDQGGSFHTQGTPQSPSETMSRHKSSAGTKQHSSFNAAMIYPIDVCTVYQQQLQRTLSGPPPAASVPRTWACEFSTISQVVILSMNVKRSMSQLICA